MGEEKNGRKKFRQPIKSCPPIIIWFLLTSYSTLAIMSRYPQNLPHQCLRTWRHGVGLLLLGTSLAAEPFKLCHIDGITSCSLSRSISTGRSLSITIDHLGSEGKISGENIKLSTLTACPSYSYQLDFLRILVCMCLVFKLTLFCGKLEEILENIQNLLVVSKTMFRQIIQSSFIWDCE